MTKFSGAAEMLRELSRLAHGEMVEAILDVEEPQSWAVLPQAGPDYLHSDGSIHGITLHVATAKIMYGSIGFRDTEVRWRDLADRVERFEPSWQAARELLDEAQRYWLSCIEPITDADLHRVVPHFSGKLLPAWRIMQIMIHHDSYHAGQIAMLRSAVTGSDVRPSSVAGDLKTHCSALPSW
jgi:uncharacterized damage-inducible protein DinB